MTDNKKEQIRTYFPCERCTKYYAISKCMLCFKCICPKDMYVVRNYEYSAPACKKCLQCVSCKNVIFVLGKLRKCNICKEKQCDKCIDKCILKAKQQKEKAEQEQKQREEEKKLEKQFQKDLSNDKRKKICGLF